MHLDATNEKTSNSSNVFFSFKNLKKSLITSVRFHGGKKSNFKIQRSFPLVNDIELFF